MGGRDRHRQGTARRPSHAPAREHGGDARPARPPLRAGARAHGRPCRRGGHGAARGRAGAARPASAAASRIGRGRDDRDGARRPSRRARRRPRRPPPRPALDRPRAALRGRPRALHGDPRLAARRARRWRDAPAQAEAQAETEARAMTLPPGPPGPFFLHTAGWITRPGPWTRKLRARYGDVYTVRVDRRVPWVMLSHPDDVKTVFTGDPNILYAGEGNVVLKPLLGANSVLILDGPEHMAERKALLPPFHGERMKAYASLIEEIAEREIAAWPVGTPIETRPRMQALTLEIIMRAVFGTNDERLRPLLESLLDKMTDPRVMLLAVVAGPSLSDTMFHRW